MAIALILIGVLLVVLNVFSIKKDKNSFKNTLEYNENNIGKFEVEVGKLRKDMAENILDIQKELLELKGRLDNLKLGDEEISKEVHEKKLNESDYGEINSKVQLDENEEFYNNVKIKKIKELLEKGYDIDKICLELGINKGEVLLIKELYLR